ncbi:TSUP family transporter [Virgibacillus dakarensis]|uniref:Probable membrane transporter protein n=1 Tax=Lentibacillus populi TaxID=1827502 RepID=A0A9W5X4G5_9BACI|nr:sulfite exporter TauE/SafE family protein [Lentibacillus populi]MTW87207.1 TSUP family transporter [Virgibacillus dakarensis]GGB31886.1 anion permease [Lentibacillus populi]
MEITTGLLLLLIGLFAGGYGTIVGAGGGFIFVPALLIILSIDPLTAAASGLVIVFINTLTGVFGYGKQKIINYKVGINIVIGAVPGSLFGVWFLQYISTDSIVFYWVFASLLVVFGLILFFKDSSSNNKKTTNKNGFSLKPEAKWLIPLGLIMGIISSFLGIGGGWLLVPILIFTFKVPTHEATATSIFSLSIYSSVGVASHIFYHNVEWSIVYWGGVGVILGAQLGVLVAKRLPDKVIIRMLSILLCIVGLRMYFG